MVANTRSRYNLTSFAFIYSLKYLRLSAFFVFAALGHTPDRELVDIQSGVSVMIFRCVFRDNFYVGPILLLAGQCVFYRSSFLPSLS